MYLSNLVHTSTYLSMLFARELGGELRLTLGIFCRRFVHLDELSSANCQGNRISFSTKAENAPQACLSPPQGTFRGVPEANEIDSQE